MRQGVEEASRRQPTPCRRCILVSCGREVDLDCEDPITIIITLNYWEGFHSLTSLPLYREVYLDLLARIQRGEYSSGLRLPTDDQLAEQYGVSKITVRQALSVLVSEGLVERWPKRGSFVTRDLSGRVARDLSGFADDVENDRSRIGIKTLAIETVPASSWVREALEVGAQEEVTHVRRLRTVAGKPVMLLDHYLLPPPLPEELQDSVDWLFFRAYLVKAHGIIPSRYYASIKAIAAGAEIADVLHCPMGHPLLLVRKGLLDISGSPCECLEAYADTQDWTFKASSRLGMSRKTEINGSRHPGWAGIPPADAVPSHGTEPHTRGDEQ